MTPSKIPLEDIDNVLDQIIPCIETHVKPQSAHQIKRPFILALTGLQGSGKSTWTDALVNRLRNKHKYKVINISLDDLYLDHDDLISLRTANSSNKLLQTRGQPGTHDTELAVSFFTSLMDPNKETFLPSFDKSLFNGEGGRTLFRHWRSVPAGETIDILIFEGWCVGFQPLRDDQVLLRWNQARINQNDCIYPIETLKENSIEHLVQVNNNLRKYCELFMGPRYFDYLIHLDTDDLVNVYEWRMQQEHDLRQHTNSGMTDEEVVGFVKGYMPAYELYLGQLRNGLFGGEKGQLRVVLDKVRKAKSIEIVP